MTVKYGYKLLRPEVHVQMKKPQITLGLLFAYTLGSIKRGLGMFLFFGLLALASMGKQGAGVHVSQYPIYVFPPVVSRSR